MLNYEFFCCLQFFFLYTFLAVIAANIPKLATNGKALKILIATIIKPIIYYYYIKYSTLMKFQIVILY